MQLRDLMTTTVLSVGPDASLKEAARRMLEAGVSGMPVTDENGELVGVITEADFVKAEAGRRRNERRSPLRWLTHEHEIPVDEIRVGDVMTEQVITLPPGADHADAARLMEKARIKRVPIVEDEVLVGMVSRSDIMRAFARPDVEIIRELEEHVMRKVLWIDPRSVRITCEDGNLKLSGQVETRSDAELLAELARRLDGVVSVKSNMTWSIDNTKLEMAFPPSPARPFSR